MTDQEFNIKEMEFKAKIEDFKAGFKELLEKCGMTCSNDEGWINEENYDTYYCKPRVEFAIDENIKLTRNLEDIIDEIN